MPFESIPERILADSARWLTPAAPTATERAAAAFEAVHLADELLRACLRAGLTSAPADVLSARILALESDLRSEAEALRSGDECLAAIAAE